MCKAFLFTAKELYNELKALSTRILTIIDLFIFIINYEFTFLNQSAKIIPYFTYERLSLHDIF